jgi:hypothetical protein
MTTSRRGWPLVLSSLKSAGNFDFIVITTHMRWGSVEADRAG